MKPSHLLYFYSTWSLFAHALYVCKYLKSTYALAWFVMVGGAFVDLFVTEKEERRPFINLALHVAPLLLFVKPETREVHANHILLVGIAYASYMKFDYERVIKVYSRPLTSVGLENT
jgi:cytochrome c oxidase subunit IV